MRTKEELIKLEKGVAKLFYQSGLEVPRRILPNIIFDWMTAEDCFKTRMRSIISEIKTKKNFDINEYGEIIMHTGQVSKIIIHDSFNTKKANNIIKLVKERTGIDIEKI